MVSFEPANATTFSDVAVFTSNGGNRTNALSGTGLTPPQLAISPSILDFGTLVVGSSAQASFVVSNLGAASVTNGVATITAGPFTILSPDASGFSLAGFGSTNLVVRFAPTSSGSFSNAVVFTSNGGNSTNSVPATGAMQPPATLIRPHLSFGKPPTG